LNAFRRCKFIFQLLSSWAHLTFAAAASKRHRQKADEVSRCFIFFNDAWGNQQDWAAVSNSRPCKFASAFPAPVSSRQMKTRLRTIESSSLGGLEESYSIQRTGNSWGNDRGWLGKPNELRQR
jgi:hypothetical protein